MSTTIAPSSLQLSIDPVSGYLRGRSSSSSAWSNVCSDYFDQNTASGICGILGQSRDSATFTIGGTGTGSLPVSDILCPYGAVTTSDCSWNTQPGCSTESAVKLTCQQEQEFFNFQLDSHGMLLATKMSNNVQGTVCNDGITATTVQGLCKILTGTSSPNARAWTISTYSTMPINLDNVVCPATANSFEDCTYSLQNDCSNLEAIALSCDGSNHPFKGSFSIDQNSQTPDLLQITADGSVQSTYVGAGASALTTDTANKLCAWLGYVQNVVPTVGTTQVSTRYTLMDALSCPSTATSLSDCTFTLNPHEDSAASMKTVQTLNCGPNAIRNPYEIRLQGTQLEMRAPGADSFGSVWYIND